MIVEEAAAAPYVLPSTDSSSNGALDLQQFADSNVTGTDSFVHPSGSSPNILLDQQPNQVNGLFSDLSCDICGLGVQSIAENFSLAGTETIAEIVMWSGYFPNNIPTADDLTVIFHDDAAGLPGVAIDTQTSVPVVRIQTGVVLFGVEEWMHTLTLVSPVTLGPGNYWVEIFNDTGFGTDDFFWETGNPDTIGNGLPGSAWTPSAPGSDWNSDASTDLAIQLLGSENTCDNPGDVPWLSASPTAGTTPSMGSTTVDVTFDSTGLVPGVYTSTLCIQSNDPVNPVVRVPVELTIVNYPDIELDPSSLASRVPLDSQVIVPLSVGNEGLADLDWVIEEEAAPPKQPAPEYVAGLYAPSALAAPKEGVAVTTSGPDRYNPLGATVRSWNSQNGPYFTIFDLAAPETLPNVAAFLADDNFVGAGEFVNGLSYMVDSVNNVYKVDDTGTIRDQYLATAPPAGESYAGMALDPTTGVVYASSTSVATSTLYTMDVDTGNATVIGTVTGAPGLIAIAIDGSGNLFGYGIVTDSFMQIDKTTGAVSNVVPLPFDANFGQGMGYDPDTGLLYILAFNNGAFQGELWTADTTNPAAPAFNFIGILGSTDPGGLNQLSWGGTEISFDQCEPVDVPWASANPTSGTTPAGGSTVVDVTFDSTGLPLGVYTGTLCIESNDPVDQVIRVPLTMTVTMHNTYLPFVTSGSATGANQSSSSTAPLIGLTILPLAVGLLPLRKRRRE